MIVLRRYQLRSIPEKFEEVDNNVGTRWEREPEPPENEGGPPSPYFHICIHVTRDSLSYMYNVFDSQRMLVYYMYKYYDTLVGSLASNVSSLIAFRKNCFNETRMNVLR